MVQMTGKEWWWRRKGMKIPLTPMPVPKATNSGERGLMEYIVAIDAAATYTTYNGCIYADRATTQFAELAIRMCEQVWRLKGTAWQRE